MQEASSQSKSGSAKRPIRFLAGNRGYSSDLDFGSMQDRPITKCLLAAFRYLVTGIVALLLVLLLVELGAAIGSAVERPGGFARFRQFLRICHGHKPASDSGFVEGES